MVERVWQKYGAFVHQQIIWVKDRPTMTRSWYLWRHEPALFGWANGEKPEWYIHQHEPAFFGWQIGNKPFRRTDDYPNTVWEFPTTAPGEKPPHPTMKPLGVFHIPILQHTLPGQICYEPFLGSGTQIIAAHQLKRRCYAMEIEPLYCEISIQRWEAYSNERAEKLNT